MRASPRRFRRITLVVLAAAVLLGVNIPPAWSYVQEVRYDRLINSPEYMREFGHWDSFELPPENRVNAIHAALLPSGKVMLIAGSGNKEDMFATKALKSALYDPETGQSRMIPVPDDMFCGGQTLLPDGRLLVAGGTQRYEKLDGAVTNAAGAMIVKNESPAGPRSLPAGTEFVSPDGLRYRSAFDTLLPPAAKTTARNGKVTVTASQEKVFVEAADPGPAAVTEERKKYRITGMAPQDTQNVYGLGEPMSLDKQDYQGTKKSYTFDPATETWAQVPDMEYERWYATLTPMSDGRVLTVAGLDGVGQVLDGSQPEIFDPRTNTWQTRRDLNHYFPTYPALFETAKPDQMLYTGANAGYGPATKGREPGLWNLRDNAFTPIGGMRDPELLETAGSAWLGPVQDQRMAVVGGGGVGESPRATGRIDMLDLKDPNPRYTPGPSMPEGVRYPNLVNLPDDTTLISHGSADYRGKGASNNDITQSLRPDGTLTPMARTLVGRDYHAEALLLPDGRVLVAGSDPLFNDEKNTVPGTFEQRIEIFSPPYLYQGGTRPTITEAPPTMTRGQQVTVRTPDAPRITSARLIKAATATHVTTVDMRSVALDVRPAPDGVSVTVPPQQTTTPPGPYMLFLVDDRGVPSEATMVSVP